MTDKDDHFYVDYETLQANLYLLASDFESLKAYLPGYSDEGIYLECLEGIRDPMTDFPAMILSGILPLQLIAKIFNCYFLMEQLARHPASTNNAEAFINNEWWQKLRQLAKEAADGLEEIKKV
jgi:hypothetical protein